MKETLEELMGRCVQYFEMQSFSVPRIATYKTLWRQHIMPYMEKHSIRYYDSSVGENFIRSEMTRRIIADYGRDIIRSIHSLSEFQETGSISKRRKTLPKRVLLGPVGIIMEKFLLYLESLRRSEETIIKHRFFLHRMLTYLESKQVQSIEDIKEVHIITFLSTSYNNKKDVISSMRCFLRFLFEENHLKSDLSLTLHRFRYSEEKKLPSVYSKSEVLQIEASIQRADPTGKRNYAMTLLATRLGLRASDIAHLSFGHLDWNQNTITFHQIKTGREIQLPLLTVVGEALIDYLKYGRKDYKSERIFLYTRPPYSPMTNDGVANAIAQAIEASGVSVNGRRHGAHAMRHSLASRFLENKEPMPVISEALGHKSTDTTMSYLRIDITSLRQCTLEVSPISNHFYEQKGGAFYE
jgi:site-specific recombinase XerD